MDILKKSLNLTNKNIVLLCLLMIFSLITTVFVSLFKAVTLHVLVLYILMVVAFFAGFFNVIKTIVQSRRSKLSFLEGVGEYFIPMLGIGMITFGLYLISALIAMRIGMNLAGTKEQVVAALKELVPLLQAVDSTQLANVNPESAKIYLIIMLAVWLAWSILSFVILYWIPVLFIDNERNIFKSFYVGIKYLLKTFRKTFLIYVTTLLLLVLITFLSAISTLFAPALEFVFFVLSYYIAVMFLFAVFLLYEEKVV